MSQKVFTYDAKEDVEKFPIIRLWVHLTITNRRGGNNSKVEPLHKHKFFIWNAFRLY